MSILGKMFSGGAADLINSVGDVVDNLHTSKEEKLAAQHKIKKLVASYEVEMEKNITDRWKADMNSDSWLSKNIRIIGLTFLLNHESEFKSAFQRSVMFFSISTS